MSLTGGLTELCARWQALHEHLSALRLTVVEDRPLGLDLALVDRRADALDDVIGLVEEGLSNAREAREFLIPPADVASFHRSLLCSHQKQTMLQERLWSGLLSHERIAEVSDAARRHGGEWVPWARRVQEDLRHCPHKALEVGMSLIECWRAVVDQSGDHGAMARRPPSREPNSRVPAPLPAVGKGRSDHS
jgi:hypothetical protein